MFTISILSYMKRFLILFLSLLIPVFVQAQTITGGVEYNTETALNELLNSSRQAIQFSDIRQNITDKYAAENLHMTGNAVLKDRTVAKFSDGTYGIIYKKDPLHVWYYGTDGVLTHAEVKSSGQYPYKTYKYTPAGKLVNMSLRVSKDETFIYSPSGKLLAHWLGKNCYDADGKIIMTRIIQE